MLALIFQDTAPDIGWLILLLLGGLVFLAAGGEALVRGASSLALRLRLTPMVVGLTIVSLGTSFPELMVSVAAQARNQQSLAFSNVVGSNLFNIGIVLGLCALIRPLPIPGSIVRLEYPFMFVASCLAILFARDSLSTRPQIDRLEGGFFIITLVIFIAYVVHTARREVSRSPRAMSVIETPQPGQISRQPFSQPLQPFSKRVDLPLYQHSAAILLRYLIHPIDLLLGVVPLLRSELGPSG